MPCPYPPPSRPLSRDREAASAVFSFADALALRSRVTLRLPGTAMVGVVGFFRLSSSSHDIVGWGRALPHPPPSRPLSRDREAAIAVFLFADALALRSRFALRLPGTAMVGVVGFSALLRRPIPDIVGSVVSLPQPPPSRPLSRDREAASLGLLLIARDALALRSRVTLRLPGTAMVGVVGFSALPQSRPIVWQ